ncbi:MAG TPA: hypothetical protein DEO85_03515 [Maritimibacter sp.]|nr:hypothetical protein [Maritimibacter sp.]
MAWALITGASSGFGQDFARLAAMDGYDLILTARRRAPMEALAAEMTKAGRHTKVEIIEADLAEPGAAQALWEDASQGRKITVLINNAGLGYHGLHGDDIPAARTLVAVNVTAMNDLAMAALAHFRASGTKGKILNVASLAAFFPAPTMAAYHASKAFALTLTDALHFEGKPDGITVTSLCPGPTDTGFFDAAQMGQTLLTTIMEPADSAKVAEAGWRGLKRGTRSVTPGLMPKFAAFASRLTPRGLGARLNRLLWSERG